METYPLLLALYDFIPPTAFLIGGYFFIRISQRLGGQTLSRLAMSGTLLVFMGGFIQATWKLLYSMGVANIAWMREIQFILVAPGFFILMIVTILVARQDPEKHSVPVLAIATWKIPLLVVMTLSSMAVNGIMTYISFKRGARIAGAGFIVAFLALVGMGAMASGEQNLARQWIEQSINSVGQISFSVACWQLYRTITTKPGN